MPKNHFHGPVHTKRHTRKIHTGLLARVWAGTALVLLAVLAIIAAGYVYPHDRELVSIPVDSSLTAYADLRDRHDPELVTDRHGNAGTAGGVRREAGMPASLSVPAPVIKPEPVMPDSVIITVAGKRVNPAPAPPASVLPVPGPETRMLRSTRAGDVPRIAPDGTRPVDYYAARTGTPDGSRPSIALIVSGLGLDPVLTRRALEKLPAGVSLSFVPYADDPGYWAEAARNDGHEILVELPMETRGYAEDALGPAALLSSLSPEENAARLDWLMSRFGAYFAVTNYLGAYFASEPAAFVPVLDRIGKTGVAYVDDTGIAASSARITGTRILTVDRLVPPLEGGGDPDGFRRDLEALERIAGRKGMALGKTYAGPETVDEIAGWIEGLDRKGFEYVPASRLLHGRRDPVHRKTE